MKMLKTSVTSFYTTYPEARKKPQAMSGVIFRQAASIIESESFFQFRRRNALMAENACSIGFRSGEYGGKNISLHTKNEYTKSG